MSILLRLLVYVTNDVGTSKMIVPHCVWNLDLQWHTLGGERLIVNALSIVPFYVKSGI